jgi:hypothetical protein
VHGNAFRWGERDPDLPTTPWCVFCSPPYDYYEKNRQEVLDLMHFFFERSRAGSLLLVEADRRFDFGLLDDPENWVVRRYPPAVVGIYRKPLAEDRSPKSE